MSRAATRSAVLRIGTRGSELARRQTALVIDALQHTNPGIRCEVRVIRTQGDEQPDVELYHFEGQGVFVRRIEAALLAGEIDVAVHSFKDMPSAHTPGLTLAALPAREDPRDALIGSSGRGLRNLPSGACIGTGSPRRRALLLDVRPDLRVQPIRGNVDTRLRLVAESQIDGVVVAAAGLRRLGREHEVSELLDPATFIPAIGQGILAVQTREDDAAVISIVQPIDDANTRVCAAAERAVAIAVSAGCQTPVGAYAQIVGDQLQVSAFLADDSAGVGGQGPGAGDRRPGVGGQEPGAGEARQLIRAQAAGSLADAGRIGAEVGSTLLAGRGRKLGR